MITEAKNGVRSVPLRRVSVCDDELKLPCKITQSSQEIHAESKYTQYWWLDLFHGLLDWPPVITVVKLLWQYVSSVKPSCYESIPFTTIVMPDQTYLFNVSQVQIRNTDFQKAGFIIIM